MNIEDCSVGMEVVFSNPRYETWFNKRSTIVAINSPTSIRVKYIQSRIMCNHDINNLTAVEHKSIESILNKKI
jgi:hypothetical protein